ncbi:MAG: hypothetical protein IJX51_00670 [Clostridia bacterium]|nr:hypothetical protein [Clostridia bacterium]
MAKKHGYEGRNVQGGSGSEILYKDSEGVSVLRGVAECLNGTTIVDKNGNFLAVYHSTDKDFSEFKKGDINWSTS